MSNLFNNAVQHGNRGSPVILTARGGQDGAMLAAVNTGKEARSEALGNAGPPESPAHWVLTRPFEAVDLIQAIGTVLGVGHA